MLDMITPSNMIVGLNVENDFKSMRYADRGVKLDELQDFYKDSSGPFRLKDLAKELLQKVDFQEGEHSCISDARATKDLYKLREKMRFRNDFSPLQKMKRGPKPSFKLDRNDRCDCGRQ
ncbi:unnamed protein product [Orchesella dallaii]|uniref:Exonuclease domain-containing protein n=1 Tax=Orchesella dallaii TaxID=48710 RepID=A0ABP1RYK8_9HEXA